jgi:hypothetical protein
LWASHSRSIGAPEVQEDRRAVNRRMTDRMMAGVEQALAAN